MSAKIDFCGFIMISDFYALIKYYVLVVPNKKQGLAEVLNQLHLNENIFAQLQSKISYNNKESLALKNDPSQTAIKIL